MIAIVDYGMGNLGSVHNAFQFLGREATIANRPEQLRDALGIVLPGVGAFADGMRKLRERGLSKSWKLRCCVAQAISGNLFGPAIARHDGFRAWTKPGT